MCPEMSRHRPALGGARPLDARHPTGWEGEAPKEGGQIIGDPLYRGVQAVTPPLVLIESHSSPQHYDFY